MQKLAGLISLTEKYTLIVTSGTVHANPPTPRPPVVKLAAQPVPPAKTPDQAKTITELPAGKPAVVRPGLSYAEVAKTGRSYFPP